MSDDLELENESDSIDFSSEEEIVAPQRRAKQPSSSEESEEEKVELHRMTRRQRAKEGHESVEFLELPSQKASNELDKMARTLKAARRREQSAAKKEEDKVSTINKLMKRPATRKQKEASMKPQMQSKQGDQFVSKYIDSIRMPHAIYTTVEAVQASQFRGYPSIERCCQCSNPKKYSHSRTMQPLCSLECYRKVPINSV